MRRLLALLGLTSRTQLHDLTDGRLIVRACAARDPLDGSALSDPFFQRTVDRVTTATEREDAGRRLRPSWRRGVAGAIAVLALLAAAVPARADLPVVRVLQQATTPDGRFVVSVADYRRSTQFELFVAAADAPPGTDPVKIGGPVPPDHDVSNFRISLDGLHVVYRQGQTAQVVGGNWRLYVVPIAGGHVVNLTPILVRGGNVEQRFSVLPGDRVRWVADAFVDEVYQEFEASIAEKIFADGFEGGGVGAWSGPPPAQSVISPDGLWKVEISDHATPGIRETYRARPWQPITSGLQISGISIVDWDVAFFTISADSATVVSYKSCAACSNGGPYSCRVVSAISGGPVEWLCQIDLFADGFESGNLSGWSS